MLLSLLFRIVFRGYEDFFAGVGGGLKFWVCGFGGFWKIGEVKKEGVKSGNKTSCLITWAGVARFAEISAP